MEHRTHTALGQSTAELGRHQSEFVAQDIKEWRGRICRHRVLLVVNGDGQIAHAISPFTA
jgi:hypothetical protein